MVRQQEPSVLVLSLRHFLSSNECVLLLSDDCCGSLGWLGQRRGRVCRTFIQKVKSGIVDLCEVLLGSTFLAVALLQGRGACLCS